MNPSAIFLALMLPLPVLGLGVVVWLITTRRALADQPLMMIFLYLALSVRYMASFFHAYTAFPLIAGQSINAILGLLIIGIGGLLCRHHLLRYKAFVPVYLFIAVMVFSSIYNGGSPGLLNALLRQGMFIVLVITFVRVLDSAPPDGTFPPKLLSIWVVPLLFQVLSVVLDVRYRFEADGSESYIGGYVHEGVYSTLLLCGLSITVLSRGMQWRRATVYAVIFFIAIVFANYRTALLAALPLLAGHLIIGSGQGFRADMAVVVRILVGVATVIIGIVLFAFMAQRLTDIAVALSDVGSLLIPPELYNSADRKLFSGRVFIWSDYVFTTISGSLSNILIGFGPDSWEGTFTLYAHNVYVSYIYEFGFIGLGVYLLVNMSFFWIALTTRHARRWAVVACHLGYFILSVGTMPTVNIEGVFLYATICGYTLYYRMASTQKTPFLFAENALHLARVRRGKLKFT